MPGRRQELPVGNIVYSLVGCAKVQIFKGLPVVILCTALLAVPNSEYFKGLPVGNIVYGLVGCAKVQIFKVLSVSKQQSHLNNKTHKNQDLTRKWSALQQKLPVAHMTGPSETSMWNG